MSNTEDQDRAANLASLYTTPTAPLESVTVTEPADTTVPERIPLAIVPTETPEPDFSAVKVEIKPKPARQPDKKTTRRKDSQTATEPWRAFAVPRSLSGSSPYGQRINIVVNEETHKRLLELDSQLANEGQRFTVSRVALLSAAVDLIADNPEEWALKGSELEAGTYSLQGRLSAEHDMKIRQIRNSPTGKRNITAMMAAAVSQLLA